MVGGHDPVEADAPRTDPGVAIEHQPGGMAAVGQGGSIIIPAGLLHGGHIRVIRQAVGGQQYLDPGLYQQIQILQGSLVKARFHRRLLCIFSSS